MKIQLKRILALLIALSGIVSLIPVTVFAADKDAAAPSFEDSVPDLESADCGFSQDCFINPLYEDYYDWENHEVDVSEKNCGDILTADSSEYLTDDEVVTAIRSAMEARQRTLTISYMTGTKYSASDFSAFIPLAVEETGKSTQGDYLRWSYSEVKVSARYVYSNYVYRYQVTYTFSYYTTAKQEAALTEAINALLDELSISVCAPDYYKVKTVYDYICSNITYDYVNLNNSSYGLKYTAYAALINKTAVCEGYATLLYRLLTELGVSTRYISGTGDNVDHGWNIVEIDGKYYNVDVTWDASYHQAGAAYKYFLKSDNDFGNHIRDAEYATASFRSTYPMSNRNYQANSETTYNHTWDEGVVVREATYIETGLIKYTCTKCHETTTDTLPLLDAPVLAFSDIDKASYYYVPLVWAVENGVTTGVSQNAFAPEVTCSRAQVITMLWRNAGEPEPSINNPFRDVPRSSYYTKAVLWAYEKGITLGTSSTTFSPDAICTRSEIVTLLWRAEGCPTPDATENPFEDTESSGFYYNAMLWALEHDITTGVDNNCFAPRGVCSRGEVVTFLYRNMVDKTNKTPS